MSTLAEMKKFLMTLAALLIFAPLISCKTTGFEYAGMTDIATQPAELGYKGMTKLCQQKFSGSRMCTTAEVISTVNWPDEAVTSPPRMAWVEPVIVTTIIYPMYPNQPLPAWLAHQVDISGVAASMSSGTGNMSGVNCGQWRWNLSGQGGFVINAGRDQFIVDYTSCDKSLPVACCVPVP